MIVDARIMRDIIGEKLGVLTGCNASDLVATEWDASMRLTIDMRVASRAHHEMKTTIAMTANVWTLLDFGVYTTIITPVSLFGEPYASKISIEGLDDGVRDAL
jgi:hypothetical protein